ncbi:nucleotide-binding protein [Candidatus Woesearchaeota archaeon]|nr:MAG: nucleotide-binding protein [Candidatus Woesearchaeota archaeon]
MTAKRYVLLDTNFLLIPGRFGVDIFAEIDAICDFPYRLCLLKGSLRELEAIASGAGSRKQSGRDRSAASLGLELLKSKNLTIIDDSPAEGFDASASVDDRILLFALKRGAIVATQDGALKRRLREAGIPVIVLRQLSHLALEGFV